MKSDKAASVARRRRPAPAELSLRQGLVADSADASLVAACNRGQFWPVRARRLQPATTDHQLDPRIASPLRRIRHSSAPPLSRFRRLAPLRSRWRRTACPDPPRPSAAADDRNRPECDRHERRPPTPCLSSGSAASVLARRAAVFRVSSGRSTGTTGTFARETNPGFQRRLRQGTPRRNTARPGPCPAGEWMPSGSEGSLDQSGAACSTRRVNAGSVAAHTNING
jgi:hypothetical protein